MKRRSAFTFVEVLFAVMILGIGMIMVAAMFPAAAEADTGQRGRWGFRLDQRD